MFGCRDDEALKLLLKNLLHNQRSAAFYFLLHLLRRLNFIKNAILIYFIFSIGIFIKIRLYIQGEINIKLIK